MLLKIHKPLPFLIDSRTDYDLMGILRFLKATEVWMIVARFGASAGAFLSLKDTE